MSDLSGMFGVGAGALDAVNDQMKFNQNYRTLEQQYQQDQLMNPLKVQYQQGVNAEQAARLPGVVGQAQTLAAQGQVDEAGVKDKIAVAQSEALSKMDKNQLERLNGYAQKVNQIGAALVNVPEAQRTSTLQNIAEQYGIPADNPLFQSLLKIPPKDLPQKLSELGTTMAMRTNDFIQKRTLVDDKTSASIANAQTAAEARIEAMRIAHEHDMEKYRLAYSNKEKHLNITQTIAKLLGVPESQRDADWAKQYSDAMQSEAALRSAGSSANLAPEMISGGTPSTSSSRTQGAIDSVTGGQQRPAASSSPQDEKANAIKAWGSYDPNTYVYGIIPGTNKFGRRKK